MPKKESLQTSTSSRGWGRKKTSRVIDTDEYDSTLQQISEAKVLLKQAKTLNKEEAEEDLNKVKQEYDDWKNKSPDHTREELQEHWKKISSPLYDYYTNLFIEENGDNYNIRQACSACIIFDPTFLKGKAMN